MDIVVTGGWIQNFKIIREWAFVPNCRAALYFLVMDEKRELLRHTLAMVAYRGLGRWTARRRILRGLTGRVGCRWRSWRTWGTCSTGRSVWLQGIRAGTIPIRSRGLTKKR